MKQRLSRGCLRWPSQYPRRRKPTKKQDGTLLNRQNRLPLVDTLRFFFFSFFFLSVAYRPTLAHRRKTSDSKSKLFIEKNGGGWRAREDVRWRQSLERNCRFPVLRVLGTRSVEEAAPGIASSASHNPAVMAFDSYDCSDNCNDDRAAFFATSSSYQRQLHSVAGLCDEYIARSPARKLFRLICLRAKKNKKKKIRHLALKSIYSNSKANNSRTSSSSRGILVCVSLNFPTLII